MNNPICISTGCLYRVIDDINERISKIKEFSPDGIEVSFADTQSLFDFRMSESSESYLRTLKYVSIHAPWEGVVYGNSPLSDRVLDGMGILYDKVGARNVVFHVGARDDLGILKKASFTYSIENRGWRDELKTPEQIGEMLDQDSRLRFTFDFAHALTVSADDIPVYLDRFLDKIIQIHLGMLNRDMKDHWFLHKYDSPKLRDLLRLIPSNIPLVLECVASNQGEIQLMRDEIEYIRKI